MIKDIYEQEHNLFLDCFGETKEKLNGPMGFEPISNEAKAFIEQYSIRLSKEQNKVNKDEFIVYTKISMSYAIKHNLCFLSLVFHPCSLAKRKYFEAEETDEVKTVIEQVIVWETTQEKTFLDQSELEGVIKHFRSLEV